jgi:hypothetical protein
VNDASRGRARYSNPVENLNTYVMIHGGIDRHERLLDVEWLKGVVEEAQSVARLADHRGGEFENAIRRLREALKH